MLKATLNKDQLKALEGLAYWIADENYIRERFGDHDPEVQTCRKTILDCIFPELDKMQVPFWVQNTVVAFAENWRQYKQVYMKDYLKQKNIFIA